MSAAAARNRSRRPFLASSTFSLVFGARCEARALLYAAGELSLHEAVDVLQDDAVTSGLMDAIGQDSVQAILATAFRKARRDV